MVRIGLCGNQLHSHRRREMKNLVGLGRQFPDQRPVGDAAFDVAESRMVDHGGQIGDRAGRFVVHDRHAVAAGQEGLGQVAADKARPAGDENALHGSLLPRPDSLHHTNSDRTRQSRSCPVPGG